MRQRLKYYRILIDAGLALSAEQGVKALTVKSLAKEAGLACEVFYRHFHNIEDLMAVLIMEIGFNLRALIRPFAEITALGAPELLIRPVADRSQGSPVLGRQGRWSELLVPGASEPLIRAGVEEWVDYVQKNEHHFCLLAGECLGSLPNLRRARHGQMQDLIGELTQELERGAAKGDSELLDAGLTAEAVVAIAFQGGIQALEVSRHARSQLIDRIVQQILIIWRGGLCKRARPLLALVRS